jgi:hypothetical protein
MFVIVEGETSEERAEGVEERMGPSSTVRRR